MLGSIILTTLHHCNLLHWWRRPIIRIVKAWWPYEWVMNSSMETNETFDGVTPWIDASVPGSVF